MDQFGEYVHSIATDGALPEATRIWARGILQNWENSIIPSATDLRKLSLIRSALMLTPCARLAGDGGCAWLRQYGKGHGLPVPPVGERAKCCFPNAWNRCPGYRRT